MLTVGRRARLSPPETSARARALAVVLWPKGRLLAGRLPDGSSYAEIEPDGSISAKLGWWRATEGPLTVEGERLDGAAPPLKADVPDGYGPTGFQPTGITFPTEGCWKVEGSVGGARLAFVVLVRKRQRPRTSVGSPRKRGTA
jgi:hypothetical protein